jgi:phosphatidylglycerol:prolipoprotein diacylglycerol transferase
MAIQIPYINPIAIQIGPIAIHWYGLAYIVGIFIGIAIIKKLDEKYQYFLKPEFIDSFIFYTILGIILGGRIGYITFYNLPYYINNLSEIIQIWNGGMSFHGALIGLTISTYLFTKKYSLKFFAIADYIAFVSPIGIFLGRITNFINNELVGRETDWEFGIQRYGETTVRHASQLYEAFGEGLLLISIFIFLEKKYKILSKNSLTTSLFLILYGTIRFIIEYFREPDEQIGLILNTFTEGQILCAMMIIFGILIQIGKKFIFPQSAKQ